MAKLTAKAVEKMKQPGRYADGGGLYLHVRPEGSKAWVLRVVVNGRRRDFGLGSIDLLSLAEAREKALEGRKLAKEGIDPAIHWKRERSEVPTFERAALDYHASIKAGWKNEKHAAQWISTLKQYVFPIIGARTVDQIDAPLIWTVLGPIWQEKPETARRVRQRIASVLDYAKAHGWRETEAPMRALSKIASRQPKKKGKFEAMPYAELPAFMRKLETAGDTVGRMALRFTILTAARSGETRGATWDEFDLEKREWSIPGDRMKAGEPHTVTLSDAAMAILKAMAGFVEGRPGELVFKGLRGKPLSDMTLTKALRDAGVKKFTVHGMRSSFKDWAREQCPTIPDDVSEAALAHAIPNRVKASYQRTKFVEMRRQLMDSWAAYLGGASNVLRLAV